MAWTMDTWVAPKFTGIFSKCLLPFFRYTLGVIPAVQTPVSRVYNHDKGKIFPQMPEDGSLPVLVRLAILLDH